MNYLFHHLFVYLTFIITCGQTYSQLTSVSLWRQRSSQTQNRRVGKFGLGTAEQLQCPDRTLVSLARLRGNAMETDRINIIIIIKTLLQTRGQIYSSGNKLKSTSKSNGHPPPAPRKRRASLLHKL